MKERPQHGVGEAIVVALRNIVRQEHRRARVLFSKLLGESFSLILGDVQTCKAARVASTLTAALGAEQLDRP